MKSELSVDDALFLFSGQKHIWRRCVVSIGKIMVFLTAVACCNKAYASELPYLSLIYMYALLQVQYVYNKNITKYDILCQTRV